MSIQNEMVVICAVNNEETLRRDLMSSPIMQSGTVPIFTYRRAKTAGEAYNAGIEATKGEYMIFAHQDVYLPLDWELELRKNIRLLEDRNVSWGVLGCMGVTRSGEVAGTVWSSGSGREYQRRIEQPVEVCSLDEVVLVVRRSTNLVFDPRLPSFHLYGTDIVLSAANAGYKSFAINAPIIHNSNPVLGLDHGYRTAFDYMCDKWSAELPVRTLICELSSNRLSLLTTHVRLTKNQLLRKLQGRTPNRPLPSPSLKAQELGYEKPLT
jgi:hypothetical protein